MTEQSSTQREVDRLRVPINEEEANDEATVDAYRGRVEQAVEDAVACYMRRRAIVNYPLVGPEAEKLATVKSIARWGARLALGLDRNPDREVR